MPRREQHWLIWPSLFLAGLGLGSTQLPSLALSIGQPVQAPSPPAPPAPPQQPAPAQQPAGTQPAPAQQPAPQQGQSAGPQHAQQGTTSVAPPQNTPPSSPTQAAAAQQPGGAAAAPAGATPPSRPAPELLALRSAERELFPRFPPSAPPPLASPAPLPPMSHPSVSAAMGFDWSKGLEQGWPEGVRLPALPVRATPELARYIGYFSGSREGRKMFEVWLRRSGLYRDVFVQILRQHQLPIELVAVSFIESGLRPSAVSPAGATGLWQFMPRTARAYGLTVTPQFDERRSIWRSTNAAATHLTDLYGRFQSWELALAAYNLGHRRLDKALKEVGSRDFWAVAQTPGSIPRETRLYVPKVLALAVILNNLDYFRFNGVEPMRPLRGLPINVPPGVSLELIARASRTTVKHIRALNPELRGATTPELGRKIAVYVPEVSHRQAQVMLPALVGQTSGQDRNGFGSPYIAHRPVPSQLQPPQQPAPSPLPQQYDSPPVTSWMGPLRRWEQPAQPLGPVAPSGPRDWVEWGRTAAQTTLPTAGSRLGKLDQRNPVAVEPGIQYQVKKGDSIWSISRSFGLPEAQILKDNRIRHASLIQVGDWLWLRAPTLLKASHKPQL